MPLAVPCATLRLPTMEGGCDSGDGRMRCCRRIREMNMIAKLRQAAMPIGVGLAGLAAYVLLQVTKP